MRAIVPWDVGSYPYAEINYANPHAVTSVGGTSYTYDNNGNVSAIGSLDYTWDWRNRLSSAERSGGGITSYGYDHTGQRVFQATGSATTSYPNRYYNVASSSLTATTTKHVFSPDGTLLATVVGASTTAITTYLHPDHLGGTNVTTDEDGEVTQTLDYYPYGSQRIASGSFSEQRRFIGEEYDGDTEFSYLNARYYQGSRGQFMSQDPVYIDLGVDRRTKALLADPQLQNAYAYSKNNPLVLKDSTGAFIDVPWISNNLYFQESATAAYDQSAAWRFALDNPGWTSALVGATVGPASLTVGAPALRLYGYYDTMRNVGNFSEQLWKNPSGYTERQIQSTASVTYLDLLGRIASLVTPKPSKELYESLRSIIGSFTNISQQLDSQGGNTQSINGRAGSAGGGTISVSGTNIPRSRDPVGVGSSGAPVYCWGVCN